MKKNYLLISAIATALSQQAIANEQEFTLGKITVGSETTQKVESHKVDVEEMQKQGLTDVGEAIARIPGVILDPAVGRRAESKASIRGFDSRQITLNIDGIPVYLPYDGNIDLSRYLTGELQSIEVQKSLGSLLLGPNNMGGSINLVSRKPTEEIEGSATFGIETGAHGVFSKFGSIQLGSKLNDKFYIQTGISSINKTDFPLASNYQPKVNEKAGEVLQGKGNRLRTGSDSQTASLKFGYTPNDTDEYVLSYHQVEGSKEAPLPAGAKQFGQIADWEWPQWDKQSLYFLSHTQFGDTYLKTRLYHDHFDNELIMYNFNEKSQYDDTIYGGSVEVGHQLNQHLIKAALHAKFDEHKERAKDLKDKPTSGWDTFQNEIFSLGLEDRWQLADKTAITLGYRQDRYEVTKTDDGDSKTHPSDVQTAHNFQLKVEQQIGEHTLFGGVSKKTRYPSIKELYSYRLGTAVPNANLGAETALHYEIGSLGKFNDIGYQFNLFYSDLDDAIESVKLVSGVDAGKNQNQNVGTAKQYGAEIMANIPLTQLTSLDLGYAYLKRKLADTSLKATGSPEHQAMATFNFFPTDKLDLAADWQIYSSLENATDGSERTGGYNLVHFRASYQINDMWSTNAALRNALDNNYTVAYQEPMQGRSLWLSLNARF